MILPKRLKKGDYAIIVSLSSGVLGEKHMRHQIKLIKKRLKEFNLKVKFSKHSLMGSKFLSNHPEKRAEDLITAFKNKKIKLILTAIGGKDTHLTLPYLMNNNFSKLVKENPKLFIGFSDTTVNHLMLYKMGLVTYYGQNAVCDFAEHSYNMLPYTKKWFNTLLNKEIKEITPPEKWAKERSAYLASQIGKSRDYLNHEGHIFIQGDKKVSGALLGGCLERLYEILLREQEYPLNKENEKIFPPLSEWENKILFIETTDKKPSPDSVLTMLNKLREFGVFNKINGVIIGKPSENAFFNDYLQLFTTFFANFDFPVVYNLSFGHTAPRLILAYGQEIVVDSKNKKIYYTTPIVK